MLKRINRFIVIILVAFAAVAGIVAMRQVPLEALPDLSDVQVIVQVDYEGQAPQIIEDQVTYPVASELLRVPGAQTVRGYSFFGISFVYVIFADGTDLYWARSRVLENLSALQRQDSILASFPEVVSVFGKAGRANTATDPSGFDMFETTIVLKPESEWRPGVTLEKLVAEMDDAVRFPGLTNSWTMPIQGRIDMLATGIRTPVGIKIFGPDLAELERIGKEIEGHLQMVPGTRSAFAERAVSGFYVDVEIDRAAAARYGLNVREIHDDLGAAVGGMTITRMVEGRERYPIRLRYPQELRDDPEKLA